VYFGLIGFSLFIDFALFRVSIVLNFLSMPLGNSVSFFYSDKLIQSGANLIKRIKSTDWRAEVLAARAPT
jgi:hypothetical protein